METTSSAVAADMSFYSNAALSGADRKSPEKVAGMFEAMFYRMLLQQARDSSLSDGLFDSPEMKQIEGMFDDELAQYMGAQGHLGVADLINERQAKMVSVEELNPTAGLLKAPNSMER